MSHTADESRDESKDDEQRDDARDPSRGGAGDGDGRRRRHSDQASQQQTATATAGPAFAAPEPQRVEDLSVELMKILPRSSGQMVRCRRIVGDQYRCNWWGARDASSYDNPGGGLMITRYRVIKSRMLRATVTRDGVAIDADGAQ
jgi:hypothetical protein